MSHDDFQDENPYASPRDSCPPGIDPYGRFEPERVAADLMDVAIYLTRAGTIIGVVLAILSLVTFTVDWLSQFSGVFWLVGVVVAAVLMHRVSKVAEREVKSVSVDEAGLHFHPDRLPPDDWPWEIIIAIRPASRWEVAWYGWFRTLFKPRDPTSCNSALGHYRVQGTTDYCFFPPKNPEAFVEAIARYRPDLLRPPEQDQHVAPEKSWTSPLDWR